MNVKHEAIVESQDSISKAVKIVIAVIPIVAILILSLSSVLLSRK